MSARSGIAQAKRLAPLAATGVSDRLTTQSTHIVAIGLLTQQDLTLLGRGFDRAFPLDPAPCFDDLLRAIDEAENKLSMADAGGRVSTAD